MVFENAQEREASWRVDRNGIDGDEEQQVSYEADQSVQNC